MWIDSHAHLTDDRFAGEAAAVVERARDAGVGTIVTIGTTLEGSRAAIGLAESLPDVYAAVGIHPHAADTATAEALAEIERLAVHPRVVAIGETGIDHHYDNAPRDAQRASFARHLGSGRASGSPSSSTAARPTTRSSSSSARTAPAPPASSTASPAAARCWRPPSRSAGTSPSRG